MSSDCSRSVGVHFIENVGIERISSGGTPYKTFGTRRALATKIQVIVHLSIPEIIKMRVILLENLQAIDNNRTLNLCAFCLYCCLLFVPLLVVVVA